MALKIEGVVNGGVHIEKTLGGASRLEPLHFALSSSRRLMRVLGSIVLCALPRCTVLPGERPGLLANYATYYKPASLHPSLYVIEEKRFC